MENNERPERWWNSTPKIIKGKFVCVAILPDGEETTDLFSLEELASLLTMRAPDVWESPVILASSAKCPHAGYARR